jgi:hypothetical protein
MWITYQNYKHVYTYRTSLANLKLTLIIKIIICKNIHKFIGTQNIDGGGVPL